LLSWRAKIEKVRPGVDAYALPCEQDAFAFISKSKLLSEYQKARANKFKSLSRVSRALFNIVFAHGSQSLDASSTETFYLRALAVLDERTLGGTSEEFGTTSHQSQHLMYHALLTAMWCKRFFFFVFSSRISSGPFQVGRFTHRPSKRLSNVAYTRQRHTFTSLG